MKKKVLFLIHDLGQGGAEKVLVNLVNNLDRSKFDIHVIALFGGGINEQFLKKDICYRVIFPKAFPGNSKVMKLLTARQLHEICVKEYYDIEIAYLEGPSARIISGCPYTETKLISWIHVEQHSIEKVAKSFRSIKEAKACYNSFDQIVCVSKNVYDDFCTVLDYQKPCTVIYNTVESDKILALSRENVDGYRKKNMLHLVAVGTLKYSKGYDRLLNIIRKLIQEGYPIILYVLGIGPLMKEMQKYIKDNHLESNIILLGYDTNPYKYVAKSDIFVCSSRAEGFSTAVSEALILGVPVCTVNVSGMKELLGNNNEYGIVTENSEDALYKGLLELINSKGLLKHYSKMASIRGEMFSTANTVSTVEGLFLDI